MTISTDDRRKEYEGNGLTKQFTGPRAFLASHISVYLVDDETLISTLQTAYTLTGVGVRNRQTVVSMGTAPPIGTTLLILRTVPYEQGTNITNQGAYLPQVVEDALDYKEQEIQQLSDDAKRSLKAPDSATGDAWDFDARGRRIRGVADGTATTDAATYGQMIDKIQTAVSNPNSALFLQDGAGAVARPVNQKLRDSRTIKDADAVGDGVADDTAAVAWAEGSPYSYINLLNLTIKTTALPSSLTKGYYGGQVLATNSLGNLERVKPRAPINDYEVSRPRTKSPLLDWTDKAVLWLGTSIPHQGVGVDGYPELFGRALGCRITNMAWSGSTATYDKNGDAFNLQTIKALSMTEDDRLAGLALYGPTSVYDDSFDVVNKASQMTVDYRIKQKFAATPFNVVMLDHNHNDRVGAPGTLSPESLTITSITRGATTTVNVAALGSLTVGDAVALSVVGIDKLNYAAGRVQSVAGNSFTLNINSSGYLGAFVSGSVKKLDRKTIYGAWEFLINAIYNAALVNDAELPKIILSGAPSEYTNGVADNAIFSVGRYIKDVADKWGLAFFDVGHIYDVKLPEQATYFPDNVHPTTKATRQALANHWVQWASGGAVLLRNASDTLQRGGTAAFTDQREALYTRFTGGWSTPKFIVGATSTLLNEPFASLAAWTSNSAGGGTAPALVAAPWGAGNAVRCVTSASGQTSFLSKLALAFNAGYNAIEFDLYLPAVTGLTPTSTAKTVDLMHIRAAGAYHTLALVVRPGSTSLQHRYFKTPNVDLVNVAMVSHALVAATKHRVKVEFVKATAGYMGAILVSLDGVLISSAIETVDSGQPTPDRCFIGTISTNTAAAFTLYFGNLLLSTATASDYSNRYTGTFTTTDGKTVTVVNGIIVSAV